MGVENVRSMFPVVMEFLSVVTNQLNKAKNRNVNKEAAVLIFSAAASFNMQFCIYGINWILQLKFVY